MAKSAKRVCWDACAWIALIQDEEIRDEKTGQLIENRGAMCRAVIELAKKGKIEIVTSALSLAEVCKNRNIKDDDPSKIAAFFEHEFVLLSNLDRTVGERARVLMMSGLSGLKPADACHLATAAVAPNVSELHTFDGDLLNLDLKIEKADKAMLRICRPDASVGVEPPLLGAMRRGQGSTTTEPQGEEESG